MSETRTITLHWLEGSRAQRILWLLEELDLDYKLKLYHRDEGKRADPELVKIHPLGKSPVIEIDHHDGAKPRVITESGYIISYLTKNFDSKGLLKPVNDIDQDQVEFYLHYAEGTVQPFFTYLAVHGVGVAKTPFLMKHVVSKFVDAVDGQYTNAELKKNLDWLESNLNEKKGDYFVGEKLSGADIIFHFIIFLAFKTDRLKSWLTSESYPNLKKWLDKIESRPKFKAAQERIKTEGKGKFSIGF